MAKTKNILSLLKPSSKTGIINANNESISFSELFQQIGIFAGGLKKKGISEGDRVLILIPMSIELYIAILAVFWIGGTVVLVDPSAPLDQILGRFKPHAFIGSGKAHLLRMKHTALRGLKLYISTGLTPLFHRRMASIRDHTPNISTPKFPALLTFTTGSTGQPKAIARSHQFLLDQHKALSHHMFFDEEDIDMPTLPVFLLHSLAGGATCVLADADLSKVGLVNPNRLIPQIKRHSVTSLSGSPAFFEPIIRHLLRSEKTINTVKRIFTGGARVNARIVKGLCEAFPKAKIYIVYGSTEAEPIAVLDGRKNLNDLLNGEQTGKGALVGKPVKEINVRIENDEILVSGKHVNLKYYQDKSSDQKIKVLRDGIVWHRTGDSGYLDKNGRIWLLGRANGKIAGSWPMPIEGQAESLDFVRKAALTSLDDKPVLVVELTNPPPDWKAQLRPICSIVFSVKEIPVDPRHNSKIDRNRLNSMLKASDRL